MLSARNGELLKTNKKKNEINEHFAPQSWFTGRKARATKGDAAFNKTTVI